MFFGKHRSGSLLILKWHRGVGNFVLRFKTEVFMKLQLKDILLGVATAATQIEGDDRNNSWYDWAERGNVSDGSSPVLANQHYRLYRQDIDLMAQMGIQCYRFGVEWSRIQPSEGTFDEQALQHYLDEVRYMKSKGIEPMLTLHHFTNPLWFERSGGWERKDASRVFISFAEKVLQYLGEEVSLYVTVNEPNVYATNGYFYGSWPPGKKSMSAVKRVLTNMTRAHIDAYGLIHDFREKRQLKDTKVGFANHLRVFEPQNGKNPYHRVCARLMEKIFQTSLTDAMMTGRCVFPVGKTGRPVGKYYDFIGINYYTRSTVSGFKDGVKKGAPVNDLGWEIYPEGIAQLAKKLYDKYRAPVFITENGTCDAADAFRSKYIYDHLYALTNSGVPVERYYHWTFIDNFEWAEGQSAPFGLVALDFNTQQRTIRPSGLFYSDIIKNHGVTQQAYDKYIGEKQDGRTAD